VQGLLEHVADLALAHGAADVHRHRRHELGGDLLLDEEVADLGAVAVRHDDAVALGDHLGDAPRRAVDVDELLLEGPDLAGLQDGVAAEGDDDGAALRMHDATSIGMVPSLASHVMMTTTFVAQAKLLA